MAVKAKNVEENNSEVKKDKSSTLVAVALGVAGVSLLFSAGTAFANVNPAGHDRGFAVEQQAGQGMQNGGMSDRDGDKGGRHGDRDGDGGRGEMPGGQDSQMRQGIKDDGQGLNQSGSETLNVPNGDVQMKSQMGMNTNTGAS